MIGELLGHYRIKSALGAGGMGEVFRATDTTLGREVALKALPAEMASNPERLERFKREAKALAALDHPAVVGVYSVEESNGIHFLTMQLVEGETIESLIAGGRMEVPLILDIATALADALVAARWRRAGKRANSIPPSSCWTRCRERRCASWDASTKRWPPFTISKRSSNSRPSVSPSPTTASAAEAMPWP